MQCNARGGGGVIAEYYEGWVRLEQITTTMLIMPRVSKQMKEVHFIIIVQPIQ